MIPSKASAKISMRLVPNQDYRKISRLFERYFRSIAPKSVKVKVKSLAEDAIHSPNESYGLEQFDRGVETIPLFYRYFAAEK